MATELRKSAGSDIKRLQEMVKRLEEQNAQLKSSDLTSSGNASSKGRVMGEENMVKVKLNLDDVPLLDLNAGVEEDEDTWLYVSPNHPPSAEQKKISPYKFLKDSLDVPELNKVKGSLLAKLESIAAQEEALSRSPPDISAANNVGTPKEEVPAKSSLLQNNCDHIDVSDDDDEPIQVRPRRRVPSAVSAAQIDEDLVVKGPLRRRGAPPMTATPQSPRPLNSADSDDDDDDDDRNMPIPQRRVPSLPLFDSGSIDDSSLVVRGPLRRRGAPAQVRASVDAAVSYTDGNEDDNLIVPQDRLQRRVPVSQDNEDLVVKGPLRRRGPGSSSPRQQPVATGSQVRVRGGSPHGRKSIDACSHLDDNNDDDIILQDRVQRRIQVSQDNEDLVVRGPLKRRTPKPRQPVAPGYGMADYGEEHKDVQPRRRMPSPAVSSSYQEDYNSSWQREDAGYDNDIPQVTAVRRREPIQVRRREPARPRTADEVNRRSLPQAPTQRGLGNPSLAVRQSTTPPQSPAFRKPVPRTGQLPSPRRVPIPRGASPVASNEGDGWTKGFY
ncbi:SLAIN motif-containing protein 2-like [Acropora muricata]|uniref:SLAIN motif-containing protein 2-like n=1 Tax=Acropora muricata TaxID=159855 RepID=UPI0034E4732D